MENKKVLGTLFVLFLSLFTIGCSNQNADISSQDSSLSSTTSQVTTNELSKKDYKEFYQSIFNDYKKIFSTSKDTSAIMNLYKSLEATTRPINSWDLETAIFQADKMRYAYLDLNEDGVEELLVSVEHSDGSYFLTGLYYLVNE